MQITMTMIPCGMIISSHQAENITAILLGIHILRISNLTTYVSIRASTNLILRSHHIRGQILHWRPKCVLSIHPVFLLVRGALVEPPMHCVMHRVFYGLVEPPQGPIVFSKIQLIFPLRENVAKVLKQVPWEKFFLVTDAACGPFLGVQVSAVVTINMSPRQSNPIEFSEPLNRM